MLSPQLVLRTYWRLARPGRWLFPGQNPAEPVSVATLQEAGCSQGLYRRVFLQRLEAAFGAGALSFFGDLAPLAESAAFTAHLRCVRQIEWVVYAKRPFGGPQQVLDYLGRYTLAIPIGWRSPTAA